MNKKYTYEEVKNYVENEGYKLLSEKYVSAREHIITLCPNNHVYPVTFTNFKNNKRRCPECVGNKKHNGEFIYNEFVKHNLIPMFQYKDYQNAKTLLPFICPHHLDESVQYINYDNLKQNRGCHYCSIEKRKGKNHYKWDNGKTTLNHYLRNLLGEWKKESFKKANYKCYLSNYNGTLEIHHLYSFYNVVNDILMTLNLTNKEIGNYSNCELNLIEKMLLEYHSKNLGICLHPKIHDLYHSIYGHNNTPEQFEEFEQRFKLGEFNDYIKEI